MTDYRLAQKIMCIAWFHKGAEFCKTVTSSPEEAVALENAVRLTLDQANCCGALDECLEELFRPLVEAELKRLRSEKTHQLCNQKGGAKLLN